MALIPPISVFLILWFAIFSDAHNPKYQTGLLEECPMPIKTEVDFVAQGRDFKLGNISIYETLDTTPKGLLIAVYDIFGDTANTRLFSDLLAQAYGFRIVVPDFFRGVPWDHTKWPPKYAPLI